MSAQLGNTGVSNIGHDIIKSAMRSASDQDHMTGVTVSMEAMYFMETKEDDEVSELQCAKYSARLLEAFMPDKKVAVLPEHHADNFAADMLTAPSYSADLFLCSNDLDNENFGDCEDFSNFRHFFSLMSRPAVAADFPAIMMGTLDRLTSRPFGTSEATLMRIRVGHKQLRSISSLALALNTPDSAWMSRLNRTAGKRMESEPWAERTLKERLIANILSSDVDLNADRTPAQWAEIFENACDFDKVDDDCLVTGIDPSRTFVSFNHIAGEGYEVDFATNLEIVNEMCKVVDSSIVSDPEQYWSEPTNAQSIFSFLEELIDIKATAEQIKFAQIPGKIPSYYVMSNGQKMGKVSVYSNAEGNSPGMSNSVLAVGPLCVWIADEKMLPYEAAILIER